MKPRFPEKPITRSDLEEFIKTQDDFALELYVYSLARELGFTATHAGSYTDRITGKTRQFDVRASLSCGEDIHVSLAVECKCLRPSFPLLVSQIPRIPSESFQDVMQSHGVRTNGGTRNTVVGPRVNRLKGVESMYCANKYVGKASVQVGYNEGKGFVANDSEVFDKWGQAIASINGMIRDAANLTAPSGSPQRSVALPVLVVPDDSLWTANYAENGSLQEGPCQADEVQFFIGDSQNYVPDLERVFVVSHLHIVTKSRLKDFLRSFLDGGANVSLLKNSLQDF